MTRDIIDFVPVMESKGAASRNSYGAEDFMGPDALAGRNLSAYMGKRRNRNQAISSWLAVAVFARTAIALAMVALLTS